MKRGNKVNWNLTLSIILLWSCNGQFATESKISIDDWNQQTFTFAKEVCIIENFDKKIVPELAAGEETFSTLRQQVTHKFRARQDFREFILSHDSTSNFDTLYVVELHQEQKTVFVFQVDDNGYYSISFLNGSVKKLKIESINAYSDWFEEQECTNITETFCKGMYIASVIFIGGNGKVQYRTVVLNLF
jgi:hypothetical protein